MASLNIYDRTGKEVGTYDIEATDIAPHINKQLLHDVVVMYQANKRQGSAKTKNRAEIAYSTRKLYRQKGTGNARAGSRASGVRVGGGHIFARRPRDYYYRLPRKALQMATRMAIASKLKEGRVVVLDELSLDAPKTREVAQTLKSLGIDGSRVLLTTAEYDRTVYLSARNIEGVSVAPAADLNALSVLHSHRLLITKDALDKLKNSVSSSQDKKK